MTAAAGMTATLATTFDATNRLVFFADAAGAARTTAPTGLMFLSSAARATATTGLVFLSGAARSCTRTFGGTTRNSSSAGAL